MIESGSRALCFNIIYSLRQYICISFALNLVIQVGVKGVGGGNSQLQVHHRESHLHLKHLSLTSGQRDQNNVCVIFFSWHVTEIWRHIKLGQNEEESDLYDLSLGVFGPEGLRWRCTAYCYKAVGFSVQICRIQQVCAHYTTEKHRDIDAIVLVFNQ